MNTTFLWPTLAILLVATIWLTTYNVQRFTRRDTQGPRKSIGRLRAGCLFQWIMIVGMAIMGYRLAGIMGLVGVLLAVPVLSMVATFIILAATGRIVRR